MRYLLQRKLVRSPCKFIAFTVTAIPADTSDVYKEKIIGDQYEYEGKLYPLEVREEIIKVKKKDDIVLQVKSTRHGPLINSKR